MVTGSVLFLKVKLVKLNTITNLCYANFIPDYDLYDAISMK